MCYQRQNMRVNACAHSPVEAWPRAHTGMHTGVGYFVMKLSQLIPLEGKTLASKANTGGILRDLGETVFFYKTPVGLTVWCVL